MWRGCDVKIENGGIVFLNDTFTLSAPPGGELQVSGFWAGFHESISHERHNFEIFLRGDWVPVGYVDEELGNFSGYVIEPQTPVTLREGVDLRLRASYLFVNLVGERSNRFEAIIPVFPALMLKSMSDKGSIPKLGSESSLSTCATSLRNSLSLQISTASSTISTPCKLLMMIDL